MKILWALLDLATIFGWVLAPIAWLIGVPWQDAGVVGSLMAREIIREIVGFGEGLVGRLLVVDALSMRFETLSYAWDPENPITGTAPTITDLSIHASRPGRSAAPREGAA